MQKYITKKEGVCRAGGEEGVKNRRARDKEAGKRGKSYDNYLEGADSGGLRRVRKKSDRVGGAGEGKKRRG